ncbi:MAG TPA: hypothetical protein PLA68_08980, partial [Panacibacter sp.]|nr:hypothetical protein [Panacibacter sp.]
MSIVAPSLITIENNLSSVTVDLCGGAITDFHLKQNNINPLSFSFSKAQMPENNKNGAPYQGHFLCLGRWGEPSTGELNAGLPNHGEVANIEWTFAEKNSNELAMQTTAKLEGLHVERKVILDKNNPVFAVKEVVQNINSLGRLFNMVQHPTLAAPFLDDDTIVDCNGASGFNQSLYKDVSNNILKWPNVKDERGNSFDLRNPSTNYNAVFSFVVKENVEYGWVTAYSPKYNLLLGYIWKRNDYSWIHLWQHFENNHIKYRGIEFGTAGIHQPFNEILNTATNIFGERTLAYIDVGESVTKNYFSFIYNTEQG